MDVLFSGLSSAFTDLDATAFAEAIWLAAHRARDGAAAGATPVEPLLTATGTPELSTAGPRQMRTPKAPGSSRHDLYDTWEPAEEPSKARLHGVHATRVLSNTLELQRALRPFKRPWREGPSSELDIENTVRAYAETKQLTPIFRRGSERWFEVALVIDDSVTMAAWLSTATEFGDLLAQVGAFRRVAVMHLTVDRDSAMLADGNGRPCALNIIRSADARRLIIVVSDCAADGWREAAVWRVLSDWADVTPTVVLNPVHARLWRRGGLIAPAIAVTPTGIGTSNGRLAYRASLPAAGMPDWRTEEMLPLPVVGLSPVSLSRWATTLMRNDPDGCDAVLMSRRGWPDDGAATTGDLTAADLVETFQHIASDPAERLAMLCAPYSRITLAVLNVIRHELVPEATVADLAELVIGGLMLAGRDAAGPYLAFRPGVQDILMSRLREYDVWRVYEALTSYVDEYVDTPPYFLAALRDPGGFVDIPVGVRPFAHAALDALRALPWLQIPPAEKSDTEVTVETLVSVSAQAAVEPALPAESRAAAQARLALVTLDHVVQEESDIGSLLEKLNRVAAELFDLALDWDDVDPVMADRVRRQHVGLHELRQRVLRLGELEAIEATRLIEQIRRLLREAATGQ